MKIHVIYSGSFCPFHNGHLKLIEACMKYLKNRYNSDNIIFYISPSSNDYVLSKLGQQAIMLDKRVEICKLSVNHLPYCNVLDYGEPSGYKSIQRLLKNNIINKSDVVYEIGGSDFVLRLKNRFTNNRNFICVFRKDYDNNLLKELKTKNPKLILIEEEIENISSTKIRELFLKKDYDNLKKLINPNIYNYL